MKSWIKGEVKSNAFPDGRLVNRFEQLLQSLSTGLGKSIPFACQDWAATKAAYRFFDNPRIDEEAILAGHFESTRSRYEASSDMVFVMHDTTEFTYQRAQPDLIGKTSKTFVGRDKKGRPKTRTVCGLLMHSSLVVTPEGIPLGLAAAKFWTRKKFKGTNALKKSINTTRIPIEKRRASAGLKICVNRQRFWENLKNVCILVIEKAISLSYFKHQKSLILIFWYVHVSTV